MTFNTKGLMSSKKQDWTTPIILYDELDKEFMFDFDPCPVNPKFDGLKVEWGEVNFVNPPYNNSKEWIKKGYKEWKKGKTVVFLLPARTDTIVFHHFLYKNAEIRFLKGRIKFGGGNGGSAPFPSMVCILMKEDKK
jgi:site-specific DNA-methyltransferase (adenine-specific)